MELNVAIDKQFPTHDNDDKLPYLTIKPENSIILIDATVKLTLASISQTDRTTCGSALNVWIWSIKAIKIN